MVEIKKMSKLVHKKVYGLVDKIDQLLSGMDNLLSQIENETLQKTTKVETETLKKTTKVPTLPLSEKLDVIAGLIIKIAPASIAPSMSSMPPSLVVGGGVGCLIILGFTGKSLYKKYKDGKKDPNKDQPAEPADKDQPAQPDDQKNEKVD